MPWIEEVTVRRRWPLQLHVNVVEKHPVARWGNKLLLSNRGELFQPGKHIKFTEFSVLPKLTGPEGLHNKVWVNWQEIDIAIRSVEVKTTELKMDKRRALTISVTNNTSNVLTKIKLGKTEITERINRFVRVFSSDLAPDISKISTIDMRYPNGFALQKNITTGGIKSLEREV